MQLVECNFWSYIDKYITYLLKFNASWNNVHENGN